MHGHAAPREIGGRGGQGELLEGRPERHRDHVLRQVFASGCRRRSRPR
jgi:hypothetical protein